VEGAKQKEWQVENLVVGVEEKL
jgi:hypothetical protein